MRLLHYVGKKLVALRIFIRARWYGVAERFCRARARAVLDGKAPVIIRFDSPGVGLFAHLNWLAWTVAWGERTGRVLQIECISPSYAEETEADWLPSLLQAREPLPAGRAKVLTVKRWEHLPVSRELGAFSMADGRDVLRRHYAVSEEMARERDAFVRAHFDGAFVVGLHYRGTDKQIEAPRVAYGEVLKTVRRVLESAAATRGAKAVVLFVASDEADFLACVKAELPDFRVCMQEGALRSDGARPLHQTGGEGLRKAKEAFLDCLLLGETDLLIKTASMLSGWAPIIGKPMPVLSLSDPFERCLWFPDSEIAQSAFRSGQEAEAVAAAWNLKRA